MHSGHASTITFVVDPKPCCKVWLVFIKKAFHPILDPCRYTPKFGMTGPVLSSVLSQRKVFDVVLVNVIVQSEENTNACLCNNRMRGFEFNVIARDICRGSASRSAVKNSLTEKCEN